MEKSKAEESGKGLDKDVSITVETSQNDEKLVEPETEVPSKAEEKSVSISESSIPSKADFNSNAVAEASTESVQAKASLAPARNRPLQSLPHHVPKVESLSKRLDEIRKNMGEEVAYSFYVFLFIFN